MTTIFNTRKSLYINRNKRVLLFIISLIFLTFVFNTIFNGKFSIISPLANGFGLHPLQESKSQKEVFGFAPYWTINKLENVDFNVLTTLAYFGIPVKGDGTLDTDYRGYNIFHSQQATSLFQTAHEHGTRVVLTISQMDNDEIKKLLDDKNAQTASIHTIVSLVENRGIDGVNLDLEYSGNPGSKYRGLYSTYVKDLTDAMHAVNPYAKVTVSVYASAGKQSTLYDISRLGADSDGVFMMAYDFAVAGSSYAIPTAPLYGHKEGKYWYDVSTAVEDFLQYMPAEKLILGVPWYGYNYMVTEPNVKAPTYSSSWRGRNYAQTYKLVSDEVKEDMPGTDGYLSGWDELGQVGWKAYYVSATDTWRMVFIDDVKSLDLKFEYAKQKSLGGVGIWALGFDDGKNEFWTLLNQKFGTKYADASVGKRKIANL